MFFCDKARDALGLVEAFEGLVAGASNDAIDIAAASAKATFNTFFTAQSVEMDAEFKRVHKAAKDLGVVQERAFRYLNIVLSKFVHPTALIVNSAMDDAQRSGATVQTPMVVDFGEGGGWAPAGAGDGSEPQSVNSREAAAAAACRSASR